MAHFYERLSSLDQTFLSFETPTTQMHIALTAIFESGPLQVGARGVRIDRIRQHIASRLHLIPRYRQRLARIPVLQDPVWVDDDHFALDYHVRHACLPGSGDESQLRARCEEILERPLDRTRPLWEIWVIEGLAEGRFALLTKVHHSLVDGVGGVGILTTLLSLEADQELSPEPPWTPRRQPANASLLRDEVARRGASLLTFGRRLGSFGRHPATTVHDVGRRAGALWSLAAGNLRRTPATPLNQPVGPHRRVHWLSFDLREMKSVKQALGGTVNDVVLATVAGALRCFFLARAIAPTDDFKVAAPVNVRVPHAPSSAGNQVSIWLLRLPLGEPDPRRRFVAVRDATAKQKAQGSADAATLLTEAGEWAGAGVVHFATRLIALASPYNLIVTNVPGPPVPLYLLGARMQAAFPYLPLFESQGLGIALFSYRERITWGLTGDWDLLPDLAAFGAALESAFLELRLAAATDALARSHAPGREAIPSPPMSMPTSWTTPGARSVGARASK